eukprot:Rmarinus@m.29976
MVLTTSFETEELEREQLRIQKWASVISTHPVERSIPMIQRRVQNGVPNCLRGLVWRMLVQATASTPPHQETYKSLVEKPSPVEDEILRDITRTFPNHPYFGERDGLGQRTLFNVLKAYSIYDREIAYCQGMGFIVGLLLLYMKEEEAFRVLVSLIDGYKLRSLFAPGLPELNSYLHALDKLTAQYMPELTNHFDREGIHSSMFASSWFLSVFLYNFHFPFVLRVWDVFLSDGFIALFRTSLALLKFAETDLRSRQFEEIIAYLKTDLPLQAAENTSTILEISVSLGVSERDIAAFIDDYKEKTGSKADQNGSSQSIVSSTVGNGRSLSPRNM